MSMKERIFESFNVEHSFYEDLTSSAEKQARLLAALYPLSVDEQDAIDSYDKSFMTKFTYNSAAIEGSTLSLPETALVLEGEFEPSKDSRARDVFAAMGIRDGCYFAERSRDQGRCLDEDLIKDIHERTALDCQPRARGVYRVSPVTINGSLTVTADPYSVREHMGDLVFAAENSPAHPIVRAAAFHAMFENIHPFKDGNGRTGRIIMNYMLMDAGYPPVAIRVSSKAEYYTALEDWQVRGISEPLIENVADRIVEECLARREAIEITREMSLRTRMTLEVRR